MDEASFAKILDAIYDASVVPGQWNAALELLGSAFKCNVTTLIDRNTRTMQGSAISTGIDAAGQAEYFSTWTAKNVFIEKTPRWSAGSIVTDQQLLPKTRLMASDYYNGFMKPRDMHSLLRVSMRVEEGLHQSISLMRPKMYGEFEVSDVERCQKFLPHLQRAVHVGARLTTSAAMVQSLTHLLEEHLDGIVLVDHVGSVLFANRAACAMADMKDGFALRRDRVEALQGDHNRAFQKLLSGALGGSADTHAARAGTMRFARNTGARDYIVRLAPLPRLPTVSSKSIPRACITISDPTAAPQQPLKTLQELYGLTGAEAKVAHRLFAGETPEQAARALNIKISTARTHIAQIFRKTDVRRQSELIGLVLRLR